MREREMRQKEEGDRAEESRVSTGTFNDLWCAEQLQLIRETLWA